MAMLTRDEAARVIFSADDLGKNEKLLLSVMLYRSDPFYCCHQGIVALSRETKISRWTIRGIIDRLVGMGYLKEGADGYELIFAQHGNPQTGRATPQNGGSPPHNRESKTGAHRLQLTDVEARLLLRYCQSRENELTVLSTSGMTVAKEKRLEILAEIDLATDLIEKLQGFIQTYFANPPTSYFSNRATGGA